MATRNKTIEFAFDTRLTTLATDTTLATSARHDFTAITAYIPESGVTFQSVVVEVSCRSSWTSQVNVTGWRIGIKLGAVAFSDADYTPTAIPNNGTEFAHRFTRDVTSYFTTNWSGTSMTCQVGFAVSTSAARALNNITAKLLITYSYDDASGTHIKTVRIPIQSHHTTLTGAQQEIGTTAGANNAPANQIPALDTFLPEASKTIRQAFIEIVGSDGRANTTDFNLAVQIDAAAASNRATLEAQLPGSVWFRDLFLYDTSTFSTASAHALKLAGSTTNRFPCVGAVLVVTYEFDPASTTTVLNSLMIPLAGQDMAYHLDGTVTADAAAHELELWVEEPGTITLVQSGLLIWPINNNTSTSPVVVWAGSQSERTYTLPALEASGAQWFVHRVDHGSGWTLTRGRNALVWKVYTTSSEGVGLAGGFAILNYTSGQASQGVGAHNRSVAVQACDYQSSGATASERAIASGTFKVPTLGASRWWLNALGLEKLTIPSVRANIIPCPENVRLELQAGEFNADGWLLLAKTPNSPAFKDLGNYDTTLDVTRHCNRHDQATGKLAPTTARAARVRGEPGGHLYSALRWWATFHEITFSVAGTVSGYSGGGSGIDVDVFTTVDDSLVASGVTATGGTYTVPVYDSANAHYAVARQDATRVGRSDNTTPS